MFLRNNIYVKRANSHMNKKHIIFILQGGKGGTSEYIKMMLKYLNSDKYEITVICHGEVYEELSNLGYNTHYVEMVREISVVKDFISLKNILSYLKSNKTDMVYSHSSKGGVLGRIAAGFLRIPNLYNPHGWSFNMNISSKKKKFYILVEKIVSIFTHKIIMISEAEYNEAFLKGIVSKKKLVLITNGIDLERYSRKSDDYFKQSLNIPANFKVVGMMGRLTEQKSPQTFIEIAKVVTDSYSDCKFILIGDGELKSPLEKRVSALNLEGKIIFTGWVNDPEKYISIMDVGVLTSKWEGFGLVLAEMMASGKPIVASKVDGIPFVVRNNIDGFLCRPDDVKGFAKYILRLLNEDDLYKSMSESSYKHAREQFDLNRVIRQHEIVFDSF
jgi:glycosyltransferase involved in cell wall biosynthesis